jgi:hypothetical protein
MEINKDQYFEDYLKEIKRRNRKNNKLDALIQKFIANLKDPNHQEMNQNLKKKPNMYST